MNNCTISENPDAVVEQLSNHLARVTYEPDTSTQLASSSDGISGQFVVQYDVERTLSGGEIQVLEAQSSGVKGHIKAKGEVSKVTWNHYLLLDVMMFSALSSIISLLRNIMTSQIIHHGAYFPVMFFKQPFVYELLQIDKFEVILSMVTHWVKKRYISKSQ